MARGDDQQMTIAGLRSLSQKYVTNARDCQTIAAFLQKQNASLFWQSQAATTFKQHMSDYMRALNAFHDDFVALSTELNNRAQLLEISGNR